MPPAAFTALLAAALEPPRFSWLIFICLLAVLGASSAMFVVLTRRSTHNRHHVALAEWAAEHGFSRHRRGRAVRLPPVLAPLRAPALVLLQSPRATFCKLDLSNPPGTSAPTHLLVHAINSEWTAAAMRPRERPNSVLDSYALTPYPAFSSERFSVLAADAIAARRLARGRAPALLPANLALLLIGDRLVLDFSARPFDPIELDRMLALAKQLAAAV